MQARFAHYALALAVYAAAIMVALLDARAHGEAQWIMDNPGYVDLDGRHCCGPSDGGRSDASQFRESDEGIWVKHGAGEVLMPRRTMVGHGLYASIDDGWWLCINGGRVRCVFKPTTGG